jgi:hypothetical protein
MRLLKCFTRPFRTRRIINKIISRAKYNYPKFDTYSGRKLIPELHIGYISFDESTGKKILHLDTKVSLVIDYGRWYSETKVIICRNGVVAIRP